MKIARRIAMLCGQSHRTIAVGADFLVNFPSLAEKAVFISDGAMDVTGAVELYANRIARQIAPVRLTGNYGSEILRGNVAFRPGKLPESLLEPEFAQSVRTAGATYQAERKATRCHSSHSSKCLGTTMRGSRSNNRNLRFAHLISTTISSP